MSAERDTTPEQRRGFGAGSGFLEGQGDPIRKGDWLYASWGYEQTNASFYHVVKRTAKTVVLHHYRSIGVRDEDGKHLGAVPNVNDIDIEHLSLVCDYGGPWHEHPKTGTACLIVREYRRKVQPASSSGNYGETVWLNRPYKLGNKWDGRPKYDTIIAGFPGH